MKLTNNRYYFDFNATSPLAQSVKDWLSRGDFSFANPSSIHSSGKAAKREVRESTNFLYETFGLKDQEYQLLYHSGASEGINQIVKGVAEKQKQLNSPIHFFYSGVDHSCIVNQVEQLKVLGHQAHELSVDENGDLNWSEAIERINQVKGVKLVNLTWVNNETGVVWPMNKIQELKDKTHAWVHVDGVQSIGKIGDWTSSFEGIDAITFSGHKFGALKGIGLSFIHRDLSFEPYIRGGGQQMGMRAGTVNSTGIASLKLALEEVLDNFDEKELRSAKNYIEAGLINTIHNQGEIFGMKAKSRNANTICFGLKETRADILATAFDLAGMDVSTGSACSSASINPSPVLMAMGADEKRAKSVLRLSFSPYLKQADQEEFLDKILGVVKRFL